MSNKKADKKFLKETIEAYKKKGISEEVLNDAYLYSEFDNPVDFFKSDTIVSSGPRISKFKNETIKRQTPIATKILDHAGKPNYKGRVSSYQAGFKGEVPGGRPFYRFDTNQFNNYIAKIRNNNK